MWTTEDHTVAVGHSLTGIILSVGESFTESPGSARYSALVPSQRRLSH